MITVFSLCFRLITCQDSLNSFSNQCQKLGEAICGEFRVERVEIISNLISGG